MTTLWRPIFLAMLFVAALAAGAAADEGASPADDDASPYEMPEVNVTGKPQVDQDKTEDTRVITGETIRESSRPSVFEAIAQHDADVYVTSRGVGFHGVSSGASGDIAIRGLGGAPTTQVLVIEDGVPDVMGIFGHPIPDAYAPFLIDRVRVVEGGDSVLYGSNALGGVILIDSRWRKPEGYELDADSAYGSYQTLRDTVGFLGHWGGWDTAGAFTYLTSQGHRAGAGGTNLVGQADARWSAPSGLSVTVREKIAHLQGADPGPASHPTPDNWYDVWRDVVSANVSYATPRLAVRAIPYANIGQHELYSGFVSHDGTFGGLAEAEWQPVDPLIALFGISADDVDADAKNPALEQTEPVHPLQTYAFYNQLSWSPWPSLALVGGTRELESPKYGFVFLYKGGAKWTFFPGFDVRARIVKNFRQPTISELYIPFPSNNPNLKPENALNIDAGFDIDVPHFEATVTGYRTYAQNFIKYFGEWPASEVINIDQLTIYGVEAHLGAKKLGPLSVFVDGDYQDVGRDYTKQNPREKYDFTIEGEHRWGAHQFLADLSGEWVRGLYQENFERGAMPDVFFMDLSLRYRVSLPRGIMLSPYLILRNLLNAQYQFIEDYPLPGLNALLGLEVGI
jgi:iron complex outermembrane receptor protein